MNGPLITTELAKMKEFVQAEDLNMKVLLDMHNFGRYCVYSNGVNSDDNQFVVIGNAQCTVDNFCDVWKKLAKEFKDYKNIWGYDIMNEPECHAGIDTVGEDSTSLYQCHSRSRYRNYAGYQW